MPKQSSSLAEFVGICLGDGCTTKYQTTVSLNAIADKDYHAYVIDLIKSIFPNVSISVVKRKSNMTDIKINSVLISDFMRKNGIVPNNKSIPGWIYKKRAYTISCLRGLFDTEGSISFKLYSYKLRKSVYKQLNFRNYNPELITFVRNNLLLLGFKPTMTLKRSIYLSSNEGINRYREVIGFSNPKLYQKSLIETFTQYSLQLEK